jgi:replication factor A1
LVQVKKKEISKGVERRIKDLSFGARDFSLEAKVVEKPTARLVFSRFAQPILVSNITISDGTGSIKLPLWNRQIDMVSVGDIVRIENGRVETFNGELLLKYGRLSVVNRLGDKKI